MRPSPLFPLFADLPTLPGVGATLAKTLARLTGGGRLLDLLWHLPSGLIDRTATPSIVAARPHAMATLAVRVIEHAPPRSRRQPWRVQCGDATGEITLVFFNARSDWLMKLLPPGETRVVSGVVEAYGEMLQMVHPDYVVPQDEADDGGLPELGLGGTRGGDGAGHEGSFTAGRPVDGASLGGARRLSTRRIVAPGPTPPGRMRAGKERPVEVQSR